MRSIVLHKAGKRFGHNWAVREVSFDIRGGQAFGIFGRAGSGKSVLIRLIAGFDTPTTGTVELQVSEDSDSAWLDAGIATALQIPGLAPDLTVSENLMLFAALWGTPRRRRSSRVAMFLELLELTEIRNLQVRHLSDGQQSAAEIARALVSGAEIVAIDGLLERLDRPTRRRVWEYILSRRRQGGTFVIATSSAEVAALCDQLAVLSRGRLHFVGEPNDLLAAISSDTIVVESVTSPVIKSTLKDRFGIVAAERNGLLQFRKPNGETEAARILSDVPSDISCLYMRASTLDDVLDHIEED